MSNAYYLELKYHSRRLCYSVSILWLNFVCFSAEGAGRGRVGNLEKSKMPQEPIRNGDSSGNFGESGSLRSAVRLTDQADQASQLAVTMGPRRPGDFLSRSRFGSEK